MAIPSGGGTEVLKNGYIKSNSAWTQLKWDTDSTASGNTTGQVEVPANCIVTILSITCCNYNSSSVSFATRMKDASNEVYIINHNGTSIPAYGTFVVSDKFVLRPTQRLQFYNSGASDIFVSYIYQDWS